MGPSFDVARRDALVFAIAVALHAAAIALVRPPAIVARGGEPPKITEAIVEVPIEPTAPDLEPTPAPASLPTPRVVAKVVASKAHGAAASIAGPTSTASNASSGSSSSSLPTAGADPASSGVATKPSTPFPSLVDPSPGKHTIVLPPESKPATKEAQVASKLDADLKQQLDQKAIDAGGGFGGPVVTAAHDASSIASAPNTGTATIAVDTNATGMVTGVTVLSFSADGTGWNAVAGRMRTILEPKRLKVPSGAAGVRVTVKVDATMKLPSGKKAGTPFNPGAWDVVDIGAQAARVVSVRIVEEKRL